MTIKTILAAAALTVTPMLAFAQCSSFHEQQVMTCAEGTVYDPDSNTCQVISS
jgi:hypothetical protein